MAAAGEEALVTVDHRSKRPPTGDNWCAYVSLCNFNPMCLYVCNSLVNTTREAAMQAKGVWEPATGETTNSRASYFKDHRSRPDLKGPCIYVSACV